MHNSNNSNEKTKENHTSIGINNPETETETKNNNVSNSSNDIKDIESRESAPLTKNTKVFNPDSSEPTSRIPNNPFTRTGGAGIATSLLTLLYAAGYAGIKGNKATSEMFNVIFSFIGLSKLNDLNALEKSAIFSGGSSATTILLWGLGELGYFGAKKCCGTNKNDNYPDVEYGTIPTEETPGFGNY